MQPLETEPAILPSELTIILEPRGRGLEPQVSTTVASAMSTLGTCCRQARYSSRTSRIRLLLHGNQAALRAEQRVEPDQAVRHPVQPRELALQLFGVAPVPAVADHDHDRPVAEHAP